MRALDIKLLRDLKRLWAQALAIALVIAGGVATLILAVGSYRSLDETRTAYYERNRFADVFAVVNRAPKTLIDQVAEIPGVAARRGADCKARAARHTRLSGARDRAGHFTAGHWRAQAQSSVYAAWPHARARPGGRGHRQRDLRQGARLRHRRPLLGDPERTQARADDRRNGAVARVHLYRRARRHHAGRPPLRDHLDVGKGACRRLQSRGRVLVARA